MRKFLEKTLVLIILFSSASVANSTEKNLIGKWFYSSTLNQHVAIECPDLLHLKNDGRYIVFNDCVGLNPKFPSIERGNWIFKKNSGELVLSNRLFETNSYFIKKDRLLVIPIQSISKNELHFYVGNGGVEVYKRWLKTPDFIALEEQSVKSNLNISSGVETTFDLGQRNEDDLKSLKLGQGEKNKIRSTYDLLKMDRTLKYSKPIKHGDVSYQWVTDPVSSFSYPLIVSHPLEHEKERLNAVLMERFWDYVLSKDACDEVIGVIGVTVNYLSSKVLDITEGGVIFCGGDSPSKIYNPRTFTFSTGKLIQWSDYFSGISEINGREKITDKALLKRMRGAIKSYHDLPEECAKLINDEDSIGMQIMEMNTITIGLHSVPKALFSCAGNYAKLPVSAFKLSPNTSKRLF